MELFLYQTALKDFLRAKRIAVWIAVCAVIFLIGKLWTEYTGTLSNREAYSQLSSILVFRVVALAAAIFSTAVLSQEVEQKTVVYLLTRPVARWKILLARTAAAMTVVILISWLAAIGVSISVFGGSAFSNGLLYGDLKTLAIGAMAYAALFVLVSLMFNRAMIICLMFAFGWETSVPNFPGDLYHLSIYSYMSAIAQHPQIEAARGFLGALAGQLGVNELTPTKAWPILIVLIAGCLGLGAWWFSHFEYLPREDAE